MEDPGQKLKKRRELLNLRYRDVEEASQTIADRRGNDDFNIVISRLSEFENRNAVPSIYKLYTLCAIYRLDFFEVLEWYGIDLSLLPADASVVSPGRTHTVEFSADVNGTVPFPLALDPGLDLRKTTFLSRMIQRWGRLPLLLMNATDPKTYRYAYVGTEDWSMHPILHPGSLLLIDETKRRIAAGGWTGEEDRPVYLLEHRDGYFLGWCTQTDRHIILQPHPSSEAPARVFTFPDEVDVLGQVVGLAMRLEPRRPRKSKG
jgi:transcriptional regulator with XRE-family HTH domain